MNHDLAKALEEYIAKLERRRDGYGELGCQEGEIVLGNVVSELTAILKDAPQPYLTVKEVR